MCNIFYCKMPILTEKVALMIIHARLNSLVSENQMRSGFMYVCMYLFVLNLFLCLLKSEKKYIKAEIRYLFVEVLKR